MKADPASIKAVEVGSIVQVTAIDDRGYGGGLLVVEEVHSWGVVGWITGMPGGLRFTWPDIEPTGGKAVTDATGKLLPDREPAPSRHHP